jgi:raffinose/stachyose/melibiose transport system permease protein
MSITQSALVVAATQGEPSAPARRKPRRGRWHVVSYALLVLLILSFTVPLFYLVNTSLKSFEEYSVNPNGLVVDPQWANFPTAWEKGNFGTYFLNTLLYTVAGAGGVTLLALLIGFPLGRGYIRASRYWYGVLASFLFLPNAIVAQYQMLIGMGLYNTRVGYIIMLVVGVGIGPMLVAGFSQSVPRELDEAAAIDGVSYWRYLWSFALPLCRPALATVFLLSAVAIWNDIILGTILFADPAKWPIATGLNAFKGVNTTDWPLLAAATMIVAIPLIVLYVFVQRFLVNAVVGAIKG